jgi:hypothetical protein
MRAIDEALKCIYLGIYYRWGRPKPDGLGQGIGPPTRPLYLLHIGYMTAAYIALATI